MQHRASEEDGRFTALTAKVGPKGQIVIPKDIRDTFGIEPGDTVLVLSDSEQGIALKPVKGNEEMFRKLFGGALSLGERPFLIEEARANVAYVSVVRWRFC